MDLATQKPWKLMWRVTVIASSIGGAVVLILLAGGRPLIEAVFGSEFLPAYPVLLVLIITPLLAMLSFPLTPMLYALDRPDGPFKAQLFGTVLYLAIVGPISWWLGIIGAATAFVVGNMVTSSALAILVVVQYRRSLPRLSPISSDIPGSARQRAIKGASMSHQISAVKATAGK